MRSAVVVVVLSFSAAAFANTPPDTPVIIEPAADSAHLIDPGDVHMATSPFVDADGDTHACSDWEIRSTAQAVVWRSSCAKGVLAVHIHLGDGTFTNAEGRLLENTSYEVRVRFRDSSGDPATEWSAWASRVFATSAGSTIKPMHIVDVLASPPPRLYGSHTASVTLPAGASVALTSETGDALLAFSPDGIVNPPALRVHALLKAIVKSGDAALSLPESTIEFSDQDAERHSVYLPAVALEPNAAVAFWIAEDGSSFDAQPSSTMPAFTVLARGGDLPWKIAEPGYRIERVATGLQLPVNIAFVPHPADAPDAPLFYVTELYGTIRTVLRDGTLRTYASGILNFDPNGIFPGSGEIGIAGTAVDPMSGDLFVAAVYAGLPGQFYPEVLRLHSFDGGRTAAMTSMVIDMTNELIGASHQISSVSIGPDGMLYVHVGDGFAIPRARDLTSFRGKILRMDLSGRPPRDNPFFDLSDDITATDFIYASGFRNPFGGAWRERDASLYEVENGPEVDRLARVVPGADYHWSGSEDDMRVGAAYNWEHSVAPVNICFIQPGTFGGSGFPDSKLDHAFVSESGPTFVSGTTDLGKRIREFTFDGSAITSTQSFVEYTGTGHATVAALAAGPDGLYFSDLYPDQGSPIGHGANVYRVRYVGQIAIAADITDAASRTVQFTASIDAPEKENVMWDFGDGTTATGDSPQHTFAGTGPYDVRVSASGASQVVLEDYKRVQFPPAPGRGLVGTYTDANGATSRLDSNVDFDWGEEMPATSEQSFDVTWSGDLIPAVSGLYTFLVRTDGQALLLVNGVPVTGPIRLEAGQRYTIELTVDDEHMGGTTQLLWSDGGLPLKVVPPGVFFPAASVRRRAAGH